MKLLKRLIAVVLGFYILVFIMLFMTFVTTNLLLILH